METKQQKQGTLKFNLKRFASFLKVFLRNGRATLGLVIILFFVFVALGAPLITPYTTLGEDPTRTGALAGRYVAPTWLRYLPTWLGGNPHLSENMVPVEDPSQPKPWPEGSWNLSVAPVASEGNISAEFSPDVSYPNVVQGFQFPNENGSLAITFQRSQGSTLGETKAYVYTDFEYPYSGPPERLIANFELLVNGTYTEIIKPQDQWYLIKILPAYQNHRYLSEGALNITTASTTGIYLAASTDINQYFANNATLVPLGYTTWQDWLNGTVNGTTTLPAHWNQTTWVASEGSLTNQTNFNVTQVRNWTAPTASLMNASKAGDTRIYVNTTSGFTTAGAYFSVGTNETAEACQTLATGPNYIDIAHPLQYDHDANETLELRAKTVQLFDDLTVTQHSGYYVLLKITITNPYDVFQLKISGINGASVLDENVLPVAGTTQWQVLRRYVSLNVPIKVRVFLGPATEPMDNMTTLFPLGTYLPAGYYINSTTFEAMIKWPYFMRANTPSTDTSVSAGDWIVSKTAPEGAIEIIDNERASQLLSMFSAAPGVFRFGMEITFLDTGSPSANVSTTVYLDDFTPKMYGTAWGLLGSDQFGRDLFAQLVYGTRISLYLGIMVAIIGVVIGLAVGLLAGYWGGAADQFLMRFNDLMLVLPGLPLMIVFVAVLGASINNLIILLGFLGWNGFARLVRSQVLSLKERPFIEAAKAQGAGTGHIVIRHILPHVMALVYISLATAVPGAITTEAALSFLGFYDPFRMSWGRMLNGVFTSGATRNWWWVVPPGLCIALLAMAFILLGFALDEILNPKLRVRR
jgi:ABC-type dipeptide/oligopeptide/nickel transport system permease subunit